LKFMSRQITVKPYQRAFRSPLCTARGEWTIRDGFLLRVVQAGHVGYGEVAPIPDFGTETQAQAADFLTDLAKQPDLPVPSELPCCAFALSAALRQIRPPVRDYAVSALLPAGEAGLERAAERIRAGYRSLKWKIGVAPLLEELSLAHRLLGSLPQGVSVRLDANASLSLAELEQWLDLLARFPQQIDYLEQPLPCGEEAAMARAMQDSGVPIALDESLNGDNGARFLESGAWAGPLVVKAALMGDLALLHERLQPVSAQVVLSSVFETGIGLESVLALADALPGISRPIGFDTVNAFDDALNHLQPAATICAASRAAYAPEQIWNSI
jgi:O-succinylbenzoate synthase